MMLFQPLRFPSVLCDCDRSEGRGSERKLAVCSVKPFLVTLGVLRDVFFYHCLKRFNPSHSFLPASSFSLGFLPQAAHVRRNAIVNLLLCSMERTGWSTSECRESTLQGDALRKKLLKWREAVFARRVVLCPV